VFISICCRMLRIIFIIFLIFGLVGINAIIPSGEMFIYRYDTSVYVAPAAFGSSLEGEYETSFYRIVQPSNEATGCSPIVDRLYPNANFYLMVSRGECSFEAKARAARKVLLILFIVIMGE
jgi:hypothetical protein